MTARVEVEAPAPSDAVLFELARAVSPRRRVRLARPDGSGGWLNSFDRQVPFSEVPPDVPYAMYLTGSDRRYRLLAFDFDASHGDPGPDVEQLGQWLEEAGVELVPVASGPSGGRHVWVALSGDGADPARVARMAYALRKHLPTLDVAPLTNPSSGCVRPPGSPHRCGGRAELLIPFETAEHRLLQAKADPELVDGLASSAGADDVDVAPVGLRGSAARGVMQDGGGPCLSGVPRLELAEPVRALLSTSPAPDADASGHGFAVLVRLALACWRWDRVSTLLDAPGLEFVRSERVGASKLRLPRPRRAALGMLRRQWDRAVAYAATLPRRERHDVDDADARYARRVTAAWQAWAAEHPREWCGPQGPANLAVLELAMSIVSRTGCLEFDLDVRRAGEQAGIDKSTAARAIGRLKLDGRLTCVQEASGRLAARYRLEIPDGCELPAGDSNDRGDSLYLTPGGTQADPRPAGRVRLQETLAEHLAIKSHDAFATAYQGGLGHHTARTAVALLDPHTRAELQDLTGYTAGTIRVHLRRLKRVGLTVSRAGGRLQLRPERLGRAAKYLGVHGLRAEQMRRHSRERRLYAWWCAEVEWMCTPAKHRRHRPAAGQGSLPLAGVRRTHPAFPRDVDGRGDFAAATALLTTTTRSRTAA